MDVTRVAKTSMELNQEDSVAIQHVQLSAVTTLIFVAITLITVSQGEGRQCLFFFRLLSLKQLPVHYG